ncbi:MAG: hypothetical protein NTY41_16160 [Proteobacteria bacterium]|nr:hypothetical protein [Pseudomonadota bacterium]
MFKRKLTQVLAKAHAAHGKLVYCEPAASTIKRAANAIEQNLRWIIGRFST